MATAPDIGDVPVPASVERLVRASAKVNEAARRSEDARAAQASAWSAAVAAANDNAHRQSRQQSAGRPPAAQSADSSASSSASSISETLSEATRAAAARSRQAALMRHQLAQRQARRRAAAQKQAREEKQAATAAANAGQIRHDRAQLEQMLRERGIDPSRVHELNHRQRQQQTQHQRYAGSALSEDTRSELPPLDPYHRRRQDARTKRAQQRTRSQPIVSPDRDASLTPNISRLLPLNFLASGSGWEFLKSLITPTNVVIAGAVVLGVSIIGLLAAHAKIIGKLGFWYGLASALPFLNGLCASLAGVEPAEMAAEIKAFNEGKHACQMQSSPVAATAPVTASTSASESPQQQQPQQREEPRQQPTKQQLPQQPAQPPPQQQPSYYQTSATTTTTTTTAASPADTIQTESDEQQMASLIAAAGQVEKQAQERSAADHATMDQLTRAVHSKSDHIRAKLLDVAIQQ